MRLHLLARVPQVARWLSEANEAVRAPMERAFTEVKALIEALGEGGAPAE